MQDVKQSTFHFTKEGSQSTGSFVDLLEFLQLCNKFVNDYSEYGMEDLHPCLYVKDDVLTIDLEFIESCECKHDRKTCIDAYNLAFAPYSKLL